MNDHKLETLIADDHRLVLEGFVRMLSEIECLGTIHTAGNGAEAYQFIKNNPSIDLLITDLEMPVLGGIALLKKVKTEFPRVKVLVLTMYNDAPLIKEVLKLDADGYVLKSADKADLELAVRSIQPGKKHFGQTLTLELAGQRETPTGKDPILLLTAREKEVLTLIAQGFSNKSIADKLFISVKTVDSHRTNVMQKLDIHNVAGLTRIAIHSKLI